MSIELFDELLGLPRTVICSHCRQPVKISGVIDGRKPILEHPYPDSQCYFFDDQIRNIFNKLHLGDMSLENFDAWCNASNSKY